MPYVPSIYKFADPIKSAYRLYYISKPFFNDDLEQKLKMPYKCLCEGIKNEVIRKEKAVLPLEHYKQNNELFVFNFGRLKEFDLIIVPGISVNLTEEANILGERPTSMGMDYFSNNIRLPDDILKAYKIALGKYVASTGKIPKNYEHELLVPWAPVLMPLRIMHRSDGVFGLEAFLRPELEKITERRRAEGKQGFGTLVRWTDTPAEEYALKGVAGNYEFSERMFLGTNKEDMPYAYLNCFNSARCMIRILQSCGKVFEFAPKTRYQGKITKRLPPEYKERITPIGGDEGVMRNAVLSKLSISDRTSIDILAGFLYRKWLQQNKVDVRPARLGVRNAKLFA